MDEKISQLLQMLANEPQTSKQQICKTLLGENANEFIDNLTIENSYTPLVNLSSIAESKGFAFRIPSNQRGYVWNTKFEQMFEKEQLQNIDEDSAKYNKAVDDLFENNTDVKKMKQNPNEQLDDFWDDLKRISERDTTEYYMGMMSLQPMSNFDAKNESLDGKKAFYVIDGQQRLTTCAILLKLLNGENEYDKLDLNYTSKATSYTKIVSSILQDEMAAVDEDSLYYQRLTLAKKFLKWKLRIEGILQDEKKIEKLKNTLTNVVKFNILFSTEEKGSLVFETLNNRGKSLTQLEILKNRVYAMLDKIDYRQSGEQNIDENEILNRKTSLSIKLLNCWTTIFDNLGKASLITDQNATELKDEEFLQAYWIVETGKVFEKTREKVIADLLEHINLDAQNIETGKIFTKSEVEKFMSSLEDFSKGWREFFNPTKNTLNANLISKICRITNDVHLRASIIAIMRSKIGQSKNEAENMGKVFGFIEKWLFFILFIYQPTKKADFSFLIEKVHSLHILGEQESKTGFKQSYNVIRELLNLIVENKGDDNGKKDKSLKNILCWQTICDWIDECYENYSGFYDWSGIRYFVYEQNLDALGDDQNLKIYPWKKIRESIEHIYPQNPRRKNCKDEENALYWEKGFTTGKVPSTDCFPKELWSHELNLQKMKNSLGNLMALSQKANRGGSNYKYPVKKKTIYIEKGSNISLKVGSKYDHWHLYYLVERNKDVFEWLIARWTNIDLSITKNGADEALDQPIEYNLALQDDAAQKTKALSKMTDFLSDENLQKREKLISKLAGTKALKDKLEKLISK